MNSSLRNSIDVNTPSIAQATVVILIFNQEQLGNAQESKDILNLSILQGIKKRKNI
jgi:hypothetical protein